MPVQVTYPGVYIEEIPSGNFVITGVATSITAFVGRAPYGPTDKPMTIYNFGDFQRFYGELSYNYPMSYTVRDFFLNGGTQAVIARLFTPDNRPEKPTACFKMRGLIGRITKISRDATDSKKGKIDFKDEIPAEMKDGDPFRIGDDLNEYKMSKIPTDGIPGTFARKDNKGISADIVSQRGRNAFRDLKPDETFFLKAANKGDWGNHVVAASDRTDIDDEVAALYNKKYGLEKKDLFNLTVSFFKSDGTETVERFTNVTKIDTEHTEFPKNPNFIEDVLMSQSVLVRYAPNESKENKGYDSPRLDTVTYLGNEDKKEGLYMLNKVDQFNLLCIPPDEPNGNTKSPVYTEAVNLCVDRRAMLIIDPPKEWTDEAEKGNYDKIKPTDSKLGVNGPAARNAAVYFPRIIAKDPELDGQARSFPACGSIAGIMAATDATRGVWKAPAGQDAGIMGIQSLQIDLSDQENGILNPLGINCLRNFSIIGPVVWGARTLRGADQLSDDYKYVPVRRLTLYVEESLYRGTQWAVFEPNDEKLWSSLRLSVGAFLADLQSQGAFYNYSVTCDGSTTTQYHIDRGIVNIHVVIAPVKPAEFVVIKIQQAAGQKAA